MSRAKQSQWRAHVDGDRPTRIQSHVETRARLRKMAATVARHRQRGSGAELRTRVVLVRLANIERMKLMYRLELFSLPEPERDQLLIALAGLISFESWDQLRHCYGLSMEAGLDVWRSAIDRMLPSATDMNIAGSP